MPSCCRKKVTNYIVSGNEWHFLDFSGSGGSGKTFTAQVLSQHLLEQSGGGLDSDVCKVSLQTLHRKKFMYCQIMFKCLLLAKGVFLVYYCF